MPADCGEERKGATGVKLAKMMNLMKMMKVMNFLEGRKRRGVRAVRGLEIDNRHESACFRHEWHPLCVINW